MSDPKAIEPVSGPDAARRRPAEPMVPIVRSSEKREREAPEPPPAPVSVPEPSPAFRPYRVMLDPETRRLFTEVIDTRTGNVLLRIPPGYVPSEEGAGDAGTSGRREVEL
ncbi:hypothetical protein [Niveispirillum fermenti]|uniref:hypothetical protein n=1 Tax=Niveispirillum fermenti TaxID=1233113 RepID=UPI003A8782B0